MTWQTWLEGRLPRWLKGTFGLRFTSTFAGLLDAYEEAARQATLQGLVELCDDGAVEHHARARNLERLPDETIPALRLRALGAWDFWSSIHRSAELAAYLALVLGIDASSTTVFDQANDDWQAGAVADDDDANADNAARHAVVITQPHPWERLEIGDPEVIGPDELIGVTMGATELSRLRRAYQKHRPGNIVGIDVFVAFGGETAEDIRTDHKPVGDLVRLPLHAAMVGYSHHGEVIGDDAIIGRKFA